MIEVKNVTKKYGNVVAVEDISFSIKDGEIVGLLGPNGAGKTTTMNILSGYIEQTSGEVTIEGYDNLKKSKKARKQIGYMPEGVPLYTDLTVKEFVTYMAELKQVDKKVRKERVENVIEKTGLTDVQNKLTRNLSRGYKQRVSMAGALVGDSKVLILDEPTVGLDPKQITEIRSLIKELGKTHTVILSSHILSEVRAVCDYIFIISHGKLVASEETEELVERMSGGQVIELKLKAEEEKVKEFFADAEHITAVETKELPEDGVTEVTVTAEKNKDVREEIFHICAESDMPILEMINGGKSLEDIFLELTSKEEE